MLAGAGTVLAIYWAVREKLRKRSELDKMNIDDL